MTEILIFLCLILFICLIVFCVSKDLDVIECLVDGFMDKRYPEDHYNAVFDQENDSVFSKERAAKAFSGVKIKEEK
jgi:hypothetical protein